MEAYLDNNVVSAIAKDDTAGESDALDRLLVAREQGRVALVTSKLSLDEIRSYAGKVGKQVERTFRLLGKVPVAQWDQVLGFHNYGDRYTWISYPLVQTDPLYDSLLKLGLGQLDAQHVFVAAKQGCTVFLTCDRGVLARANDIRRLCGIVVQKPSDLVAAQGW
jgi:hypothetical protein